MMLYDQCTTQGSYECCTLHRATTNAPAGQSAARGNEHAKSFFVLALTIHGSNRLGYVPAADVALLRQALEVCLSFTQGVAYQRVHLALSLSGLAVREGIYSLH